MPERKRFYSMRLGEPYTRRDQVGFRLSGSAKRLLVALAVARRMSVSEYLARLVHDHLAFTQRGAQ
jgi:hypothetical protein